MVVSSQLNSAGFSYVQLLSVILPAHNEAHVIKETLDELTTALTEANVSYEIIVVDDGSTDDTYKIVNAYAEARDFVSVISYQPNRGKGSALKEGILGSKGNVVSFLDSDMDIPPHFVINLLRALITRNLDVVVGSKLHIDSRISAPFHRRMLSACVRLCVRLLLRLPVQETQVGIKIFRRPVLDKILKHQKITGFAFDIEMLALANINGFVIGEEPVEINFRDQPSHVGPKSILFALRDTLILSFRLRFKWSKRLE